VRQHLSKLIGELCGKGLVGCHHQGGTLQALDQPRGGGRFAGAGGAEEDDVTLARAEASLQIVDGCGLVASGFELADHLEATAAADDLVHGAVFGVRKHGVFGRESHIHQGRTQRRQVLFLTGARP
jgi:hypothetical protein